MKVLLIGFRAMNISPHPNIVHIGYQDEISKFNAIAGCEALMMPSRFESLSIVTLEGMATGVPILLNGDCEVLQGHSDRSGAALSYRSYEDFEKQLHHVVGNAELKKSLGDKGQDLRGEKLQLAGYH